MTIIEKRRLARETELQRCYDIAKSNIELFNENLSNLRKEAIKTKEAIEYWEGMLQKVKDRAEEQGVSHIL